jgi:hypothetical protein
VPPKRLDLRPSGVVAQSRQRRHSERGSGLPSGRFLSSCCMVAPVTFMGAS